MPVTLFPGVQTHYSGRDYAILDSGAQAITWAPVGQPPALWQSPLADFEPGTAVRGGVPVVFPWFGAGPHGTRSPKHGFARTSPWHRAEVTEDVQETGELTVRYTLTSADAGTDGIGGDFAAELEAFFGNSAFRVSLTVTNTGAEPFTYEEALHTYLRVCDVARVSIDGLGGCSYTDTVKGADPSRQLQSGLVTFAGEVDRIYDCAGTVTVDDPGFSRQIRVAAHGSANTVVWNPGKALGTSIADIGPYWSEFVCVEAANVRASAVRLGPGEKHTLSQHVSLI